MNYTIFWMNNVYIDEFGILNFMTNIYFKAVMREEHRILVRMQTTVNWKEDYAN